MKFEFLPNEIFIEFLEYLNASDIFYSFDQLNYRFSKLIRTIPLHLNCQHVCKSIFDQFCMTMSSTPEIKTQIRSLHLSNNNTCLPIQAFLSFLSLDDFPHLRSLTLTKVKRKNVEQLKWMLPLLPELTCIHLMDPEYDIEELLSVISLSQLRTLSVHSLYPHFTSSDVILSIKNLTISHCSLQELCYLYRRAPVLQYLHVQNISKNNYWKYEDKYFTSDYPIYLKQLTIDNFHSGFDDLIILSKQTVSLKSLIISAVNNRDMINACLWEDLITTSFPQLISLKFKFSISYDDDILEKFQQFQSDFWNKEHRWYTEYSFDEGVASIYTIPYISSRYVLTPHTHRYQNPLMNNINTFDNVSELILYEEAITPKSSYYFSNVTSLTLENKLDFGDIDDHFLKMEHIYSLKMILNLSNVKHLTISSVFETEPSAVLLQLLKETSQLSSMAIELHRLKFFFNDDNLCKYLNKLITKLDIFNYPYDSFTSSDELEKFCQIFSNLEQLIYHVNEENDLLFSFKNFPKLSMIKIYFSPSAYRHSFTRWLEDEARKLQLPIHIELKNDDNPIVQIWIDRNLY